jgi:hypothetical protein
MLAEGIHSVIDTGIVSLMLVGMNRSLKEPDPKHPLGYGMEVYSSPTRGFRIGSWRPARGASPGT